MPTPTKEAVVAFVAEAGGPPYYEEVKPGRWVCPCCETFVIERNADRPCETCATTLTETPPNAR